MRDLDSDLDPPILRDEAPSPALRRTAAVAPYAMFAIVFLGAWLWRPPTTPTEMETLAAAWHMWREGFWLPLRQGEIAAQIPPLHLWLILAGWKVFGLGDAWPRALSALCSLASLWLIGRTARIIWPHRATTARFARLLLAGLGGFVLLVTLVQAEPIGLFAIQFGFHALMRLWQGNAEAKPLSRAFWWAAFALGVAASVFALGSALFLLLPWLALLLPAIVALRAGSRPARLFGWYLPLGLALGLAAAALFLWLRFVGGNLLAFGNGWLDPATEAARREIWSLLLVPILLYPWICWKTLWRALQRQSRDRFGPGLRLCTLFLALAGLSGLLGGWQMQGQAPILLPLSLIGARLLATQEIKAKDFHAAFPALLALFVGLFFFLMNIVPTAHLDALWRDVFGIALPIWLGGIGLVSGLVLLVAGYAIANLSPTHLFARVIQVASLPVLLATCLNIEFPYSLRQFFDLQPVAGRLAILENAGQPIAVYGPYRGEFDYFGRLTLPPAQLPDRQAALAWAADHRNGVIVSYFEGSPIRLPALPIYRGVARDRWVAIWPSSAILATEGGALDSAF